MTPGSQRGFKPFAAWTVGVGLLVGLLTLVHFSVGWSELLSPWRRLEPVQLAVALALVLGSYAIRGVRIQYYFQPDTSGHFPKVFRLVLIHNLFNNLLPMRTGEASFPILMSRGFGVPPTRSIPGLVYLRILDLHFVVFLGLSVVASGWGPGGLLLLIVTAPIPFLLFRLQGFISGQIQDREGWYANAAREVLRGLPSTPSPFWKVWAWTCINWTVKILTFSWILRALSGIPFHLAVLGSTTGELSSVLPFHGIAGAGTYEAGILAGLVPAGVEMDLALKGAVNLHLFVLGSSLVAGILAAAIPTRKIDPGESADVS